MKTTNDSICWYLHKQSLSGDDGYDYTGEHLGHTFDDGELSFLEFFWAGRLDLIINHFFFWIVHCFPSSTTAM